MHTKTTFTMGSRRFVAFGTGAMIASSLASAALAATRNVPTEYATIQEAINASFDGDEIILADGTYTGAGNKNLVFAGRGVTLQSANGPGACTIDVEGSGVIFDLTALDGSDLRIEGMTLTDSDFGFDSRGLRCIGASPTIADCIFDGFSDSSNSAGAAVVHNGGAPVFVDCTFRDNRAGDFCGGSGGAIASSNGALTVLGCRFESNIAGGGTCGGFGSGYGGAIYASDGTVVIHDSDFEANLARGDAFDFGDSYGGAVRLDNCDGTIENCSFTGNVADPFGIETRAQGGALYLFDAPEIVVRDCVFSDNLTSGSQSEGGAVWSNGGNAFVRCTFMGNTARSSSSEKFLVEGFAAGGAAWFGVRSSGESAGPSSLVNCRFQQNEAQCSFDCTFGGSFVGGAVAVMNGAETSLVNCLLAGNAAYSNGAGLYVSGAAEMINSTIANNDDPVGDGPVHTAAGGSTTARNSIIRTGEPEGLVGPGTEDVEYSNVTGGAIGTGNIDRDPDFVDAANGNYRLAAGSSSIDTGNAAALPPDEFDLDDDGNVAEPLPVDLQDYARVIAVDVDMGAYEATCAADFDGDGGVGFTDLTSLLGNWGPCPGCPQDLDGDDLVGFTDLSTLLAAWGPC